MNESIGILENLKVHYRALESNQYVFVEGLIREYMQENKLESFENNSENNFEKGLEIDESENESSKQKRLLTLQNYYFLKTKIDFLNQIELILSSHSITQNTLISSLESRISEIERELNIVIKEKVEMMDEKNIIEDKISNLKNIEHEFNLNEFSTHRNFSPPRTKELKSYLAKLEKSFAEAKKIYSEKKRKNDALSEENKTTLESLKHKIQIHDHLKCEIDLIKKQYDTKSSNSKSTSSSDPKVKSSGIFSFVKNIFSKK